METIISVGFVYFWKSSKILHSYVDAFINIGLIVGDGFGLAVVNRIFSSASVTKIGFQIDYWKTIVTNRPFSGNQFENPTNRSPFKVNEPLSVGFIEISLIDESNSSKSKMCVWPNS